VIECMLEEVPIFIPADRPNQRSDLLQLLQMNRGLVNIDAICSRKARILVDASCRVTFPLRRPKLSPGSCFVRRLEVSGLLKDQRNFYESEGVRRLLRVFHHAFAS
jgi:hypothetical protein